MKQCEPKYQEMMLSLLKRMKTWEWKVQILLIPIMLISLMMPSAFAFSLAHHTPDHHGTEVFEIHVDHPDCHECETNDHDGCIEVPPAVIVTQKSSSQHKIPSFQLLWICKHTPLCHIRHNPELANFISPLLPQQQFRGTIYII